MNYGEADARKRVQEAIFLIKKAVLELERAFNNPNCPKKEDNYQILIKANNLQKSLHDFFE